MKAEEAGEFPPVNVEFKTKVMAKNEKVNPIEVQQKLGGVDYPASKQELIDHVKNNGKDKETMKVLEQLPDKKYNSPVDVSKAVGQLNDK